MTVCIVLLNAFMASVSPCRAAIGQYWLEYFPRCKILLLIAPSTRMGVFYRSLHLFGLIFPDLPSVALSVFEGLRHAKPFIHAVVALPSLVAV